MNGLAKLFKENPGILAALGLEGAAAARAPDSDATTIGALAGAGAGTAASGLRENYLHSLRQAKAENTLFPGFETTIERTPSLKRLLKYGGIGALAGMGLGALTRKKKEEDEVPYGY